MHAPAAYMLHLDHFQTEELSRDLKNNVFVYKKMTTPSMKLWHTDEDSLTVCIKQWGWGKNSLYSIDL